MTQYSSAEDARQAIVDALGEHANTHDIDAILHDTFELRYARNEDGQILANSYRYEQTLTEEEFWTVVEKHAINPSHYDWQPGDYGELRVALGEDKILYFRIEDDHGTLTPSYDLHDGLNYYSTRNSEHWPMIEQYVPRHEWIDEISAGARFLGRERTPDPQVRDFFDQFLNTWIEGFRETHDEEAWGMSFEEWAADKRGEIRYWAEENTREIERKQTNREANAPKGPTRQDNHEKITVYSVDSCQGCRMTAQMLEKAGVPFQVIDLKERPDLVEEFRAQGLIQAPVVEHQGQRTAGFRPDRVRSIVSSMHAPDAAAIHAASQSRAQRPTAHTVPAVQRTPNTPTR